MRGGFGRGVSEDEMKKLLVSAVALVAGFGVALVQAKDEMSDKVAEQLAGFEATGESTSCLNVTRIRSIDALDDYRFLVRATGNDYYLNEVSGRCSGASRAGNRLQYTISGGQLCRNQIINVVDNSSGMMVGGCGLGSFEKLAEVPAE